MVIHSPRFTILGVMSYDVGSVMFIFWHRDAVILRNDLLSSFYRLCILLLLESSPREMYFGHALYFCFAHLLLLLISYFHSQCIIKFRE